jgi:AcrR family transcriptional regulator
MATGSAKLSNDRDGEPVPATRRPRGQRTHEALVSAARQIFERDGFQAARVADIVEVAGLAHGSFYYYFKSKEEVFEALCDQLLADMTERIWRPIGDTDPFEAIAVRNRRYWDEYTNNRQLLAVVHEASNTQVRFYEKLRGVRRVFVKRYAEFLRRLQSEGAIHTDIDPEHTAACLGSMIDDAFRWWIILGEPHDPELALETVNRLWAHAIGVPLEPGTAAQ